MKTPYGQTTTIFCAPSGEPIFRLHEAHPTEAEVREALAGAIRECDALGRAVREEPDRRRQLALLADLARAQTRAVTLDEALHRLTL